MSSRRLFTILALLMASQLTASQLTAGQLTQARADQQDCGSCTALDRATIADPVPPSDLPPPPAAHVDNQDARGKAIEVPIPGQSSGVTVFHKSGSGLWLREVAGGNVYVQPHQNKLSLDLKYGF